MTTPKIAIIGGSGLEDPEIFLNASEKYVDTPFGKPSDALITGTIGGVPCVLLSRHGRNHSISPTQVNYRANIWALKKEGCTHILVSTACGSLQENMKPGDIVFLDQVIDRTTKRASSFYDSTSGGPTGVCHIPMGEPFCAETRKVLVDAAKELNIPHHASGTTVCLEGPRFSTKAECFMHRQWGCDVVNMTTMPEVCLAKELGLCYAAMALVTDYDCWHETNAHVSVDVVMKCFRENSQKAIDIIRHAVKRIGEIDWSEHLLKTREMAIAGVMLPHGYLENREFIHI